MNATAHRFWNIAIALGLGLLAVTLTTFYVTSYKRHVQHGEKTVAVVVAAKDIPAGTSGADVIDGHYLSTTNVARREVVPGAISNQEQIRSLFSLQPVYAGEQVTARRFGTVAERGIRSQLTGTDRAYQLAGDQQQLLVGTLHAGDHVDVVASWPWGGQSGSGQPVARVILRNLLVLAVSANGGAGARLTPNDLSWTQLKLTDAESQKLEWAAENAKWHLELRPPAKSADSPGGVETAGTLLADGVNPPALHTRLATAVGGPR